MNRRLLGSLAAATLLGTLAVSTAAAPATAAPATAAPTAAPTAAATDVTRLYTGPTGSLGYQVHLPPAQAAGDPLPVVVSIHGCGMSGYGLNSMKDMTDLNRVADEEGFIVVYPTMNLLEALPLNCWPWDKREHQLRDRGIPARIAGLTRQVVADYGADPTRVHVNGASSGAGMAVIMAVTYPDLFATVTSVAGGEYAFNEVDVDDLDAVTPVDTAKRAWGVMGSHARVVPMLVVQGDRDTTVPPLLADRLVTHWATVDDLAMNGVIDGQVDDVADASRTVRTPGLRTYTERSYEPRDGGPTLIDYIVVAGMAHAWPGPGSGAFVDNEGPDLSRIVWDFVKDRRLS